MRCVYARTNSRAEAHVVFSVRTGTGALRHRLSARAQLHSRVAVHLAVFVDATLQARIVVAQAPNLFALCCATVAGADVVWTVDGDRRFTLFARLGAGREM